MTVNSQCARNMCASKQLVNDSCVFPSRKGCGCLFFENENQLSGGQCSVQPFLTNFSPQSGNRHGALQVE